jgi:pimeloyl-ACP methyl ester carboxylesterase
MLTVFLSGSAPGTPYASGPHVWGRCLSLFEQKPLLIHLQGATVDAMYRDLVATLDAKEMRECRIVGHDLGGLVALNVAAEFPQRIRAVSAIAAVPAAPTGDGVPNLTFACPPQPAYSRESQRWALERVSYSHHHIDQALLDDCVAAAPPKGAEDFAPSLMAAKARFYATCREPGYPVPAQVVWGMADPLASFEHGMWLFRMLAWKQTAAQFHAINRAGSLLFREEPEQFYQVVSAFLEAV